MNNQPKQILFGSLATAFICVFAFSSAFAAIDNKKIQSLVISNLQKKLKNDMATENVAVKLNNVEQYKISETEIGLKGNGYCIVPSEKDQLPMIFDVKVNSNDLSVTDITYDFAEFTTPTEASPTSNEEILMKQLMGKISQDYKTQNIVISIDGMEDVSNTSKKKEFTGVGEVRIGTLVWNKLKFDVVLDEATNTATKVVYKVE